MQMLSNNRWNQLVNWITFAFVMLGGLASFYFPHAQWLDEE
jgi:hypothetical protein